MAHSSEHPIPYRELDIQTVRAALPREPQLARFGEPLTRLFRLGSPFAPGLAFVGGEVDPAIVGPSGAGHGLMSLAGAGAALPEALAASIAEGIERLSNSNSRAMWSSPRLRTRLGRERARPYASGSRVTRAAPRGRAR